MQAPFFKEPAHSPNFPQTTIRCHSVRVLYSPESLSFQLTLVARENRVWAVPLGVKRVSESLPRKPMSVMRFLQNILCLLFVPLLLGRPRASGSCSQGQGTLCWGRPSGGADKAESRRPAGRRVLTPKQSPTEEDRKAGHKTARAKTTGKISKAGQRNAKGRPQSGMSAAKQWNRCTANSGLEVAVVLGKIG